MVTGEDIAASALKLEGAPYRVWDLGMSLPTWLDDGRGWLPPVSHLFQVGVECADLVDFAMEDNGIQGGAGTESFADILVDQQDFDPDAPGQPGAIALCPYRGPALGDQGHIAIYLDEHRLIQALYRDGVTRAYTDIETHNWGGSTAFEIYGFLPGVNYSEAGGKEDGNGADTAGEAGLQWRWLAIDNEGWARFDGPDWSKGWFDTSWRWRTPTDPG